MAFYQRYKSGPMAAIMRSDDELLVGRSVEVDIDLSSEILNERGLLLSSKALLDLDHEVRVLFEGKLLIDNNDPHADDLMKLKRIGAADPVLFDHGTSGPQLAFYVGRMVEEWLGRQRWNPPADDPQHIRVILSAVRLGKDEFFYDIG